MLRFSRVNDATSSVQYLLSVFDTLNLDPPYQREGNIWSRDKKQLFIDSLINGFDVPKFYFNRNALLADGMKLDSIYRYDVVDGKQRLQAVKEFFDNEYALADDFKFFDNKDYDLSGLTSVELSERYPEIFFDLQSYRFDIVVFDGMEERLIDEFFIRLNEGVALNAQERRNAMRCTISDEVRRVADKTYFMTHCLRRRARYKNVEIAAKFFAITEQVNEYGKILDTKKNRLDALYRRSLDGTLSDEVAKSIGNQVERVLNNLANVFLEEDRLLFSIGNIIIYYYAALEESELWESKGIGTLLYDFEGRRREVGRSDPAEWDDDEEEFNWILEDYNSRVQSINDGSAISFRARCVNAYLKSKGNAEVFCKAFEDSEDSDYE